MPAVPMAVPLVLLVFVSQCLANEGSYHQGTSALKMLIGDQVNIKHGDTVNFYGGGENNILFHFNPRYGIRTIVRNAKS